MAILHHKNVYLTLVVGSLQFNFEVIVTGNGTYGDVEEDRVPCNYLVGPIREIVHHHTRFDNRILDSQGLLERKRNYLMQRDPELQAIDLHTKHDHFFGVDLHKLIVCHGNRDLECNLVPVLAHVPCCCGQNKIR